MSSPGLVSSDIELFLRIVLRSMVDEAIKKSTEAAQVVIFSNEAEEEVVLDGRLAIFEKKNRWLAVSDLHFGYEMTQRVRGGLWPLWGKETVENRLSRLIEEYRPEYLILNGDVVDSGADFPGSKAWLGRIQEQCRNLILVKGNHDRGEILREFNFENQFEIGSFFFHHGHLNLSAESERIEVVGHIHPAVRFSDGAGLSLKYPSLVQERDSNRWILPAFSPWAGGVKFETQGGSRQWVCSPHRVFEI